MLSRTAASFSVSSRWMVSRVTCRSPPAGLSTKSKAPSIRAATVVGAPCAVRLLTMIDRGDSPRCLSARSTSIPSRPGICTSSVTTSGLIRAMSSTAASPSAAVPTTSTPAILPRTVRSICR